MIVDIHMLGTHSDDKDEDLKGQISKGVADYVSACNAFVSLKLWNILCLFIYVPVTHYTATCRCCFLSAV